MSQNLKSANLLNFDNSSHKTKYISQFTNKDCGKKSTLDTYEKNMYVTTLNILYNLKHGLGVFDKKNGDILQNIYEENDYIDYVKMDCNFIKFQEEFNNEDGEIMTIYEYLGITEPEEEQEEEIEDDISEEVEEEFLSEGEDYDTEPEPEPENNIDYNNYHKQPICPSKPSKLPKKKQNKTDNIEILKDNLSENKDFIKDIVYDIIDNIDFKITEKVEEKVEELVEEVKKEINNIENDIIPVKNKIKFDIDPTIKKYIKSKDRIFIRELIEKKNEDEIFLRLKNKIYSKYLKMWEDYDIVIRKQENNLYTIDEAPTRGDKNYLDFVCYILNEPHRCDFENEDYVYEY